MESTEVSWRPIAESGVASGLLRAAALPDLRQCYASGQMARQHGDMKDEYAVGESMLPWHPRKAERWFRLAAEREESRAMVRLALMRFHRIGLTRRRRADLRQERVQFLRRAAALGNADAMWNLALNSPDDEKESTRWLQAAAEAGHQAARIVLREGYTRVTCSELLVRRGESHVSDP